MANWINEVNYSGKPSISWINPYSRGDGDFVKGHFRTETNETIADNLSTDVDRDGINGYMDFDADGDGIPESINLNDISYDYPNLELENFINGLDLLL